MLKKIFLAIPFFINSLFAVGQSGSSFYEYNLNKDRLNKMSKGELIIDKTMELSIYKKAAIYDRSLFSVIGYEYLQLEKKNNAIKNYKKWVYNGGDISYIQDSTVLKIISNKYPKWRKKYIEKSNKYENIRRSVENILKNDQAYRKFIKIYRNSQDENDKKVLDSLWTLQKALDSIDRVNLYSLKDKILNKYYEAFSIYETPESISAILSHFSEKDNLNFLSDMCKYAKKGKCDWSLALGTMVFLSFKYPYKIDSDSFYLVLRKITINNNDSHLNIRASSLQLEAMQHYLSNNPTYSVVLFSFFDNKESVLQDIRQFLINRGISPGRLQIDTNVHTTISDESIFGWKIFSR